jgi:hypothetical protein
MSIVLLGSTSGSCTLQEQAIAGTTTLTLPTTSGTVLTSASSVTRSQLPTGSVLQVISTADSTQRSTSNGSFTASGMSVTITPTSATSKIFVQFSTCIYKNTDNSGYLTIYRNGSNLAGGQNQLNMINVVDRYVPCSMSYLDSPGSTSALTYEVYYYRTGSANIYINATNNNGTVGAITVMEIAG